MRVFREEWAELRESARDGEALWDQQPGSHSHPYVGLKAESRKEPWLGAERTEASTQRSEEEGHSHSPNCRLSRRSRARNT